MDLTLVPPDHAALWTPALPVSLDDPSLPALIAGMREVMASRGGIGLAAPQLGLSMRVMLFARDRVGGEVVAALNPGVVSMSRATAEGEEGCLSFPGRTVMVHRPHRITVAYHRLDGAKVSETLHWLAARVFLHELDHLNGVCVFPRPELARAGGRSLGERVDRG